MFVLYTIVSCDSILYIYITFWFQLEVQEIKKRTAILLEEKARMELEEIQIRLGKH